MGMAVCGRERFNQRFGERKAGMKMKREWVFIAMALFFFVGLAVFMSAETASAQTCKPTPEICDNKIDDDCDGLVDGLDPDCKVPPPPPKVTADCSPGFYKNHPNTWDNGICCIGQSTDPTSQCGDLAFRLCAECGASSLQRAAAKEILDTCFVTAEASPCRDDD